MTRSTDTVTDDWELWTSVKSLETVKKVIHVWGDVCLYSNAHDFWGFLTKEEVLCDPLFANHFKLIGKDGIVAITIAKSDMGFTNLRLLDLKTGCKVLLECFAAYRMFSDHLLAYRVDNGLKGAKDMKWGLINLLTGEIVMEPVSLPDDNKNSIPIADRIRHHLEQTA